MSMDLGTKVRINNLGHALTWFRIQFLLESAAATLCGAGLLYGEVRRDAGIIMVSSFAGATSLLFACRTARRIKSVDALLRSLRRNDVEGN